MSLQDARAFMTQPKARKQTAWEAFPMCFLFTAIHAGLQFPTQACRKEAGGKAIDPSVTRTIPNVSEEEEL